MMALGDGAPAPARAHPTGTLRRAGAPRDDVFFAAVAQAALPMVVTNPRQQDNPVVFVNDAFTHMTGHAPEEVLGRNCRFMQGPETDPAAVAALRRALRDRTAATVELLNYRRDGTPFWNALHISPVFGPGGELLYFFGSQLDVTRQRAAEAAWHRAQKMEAVGQLTSGIAHDFNNLLMVIAGNLELMAKADGPERRQRLSGRMREAILRAQRLTGQLLAFSRRQQLDRRAVDLNALLAALADAARRTLGPDIRLETRPEPGLPQCLVDPEKIEAALVHLLRNAREAMPNGGTVTITTEEASVGPDTPEVVAGEIPAGRYVSLTVADTGVGMTPAVLLRATEPFFTTKNDGAGSGLGLSTVYGFAQQSHGHLLLRSQPGEGTSVRLLLPCPGGADGAHAAAP